MPTTLPSLTLVMCTFPPLTSLPGLFPYQVYSTVSSGILVLLQINYIPSVSLQNAPGWHHSPYKSHKAKLSQSFLYPSVPFNGDYLHLSFVHMLYKDFDPRCPPCKVCCLNPLYIIHICLHALFNLCFSRRSAFQLVDTKLPENTDHFLFICFPIPTTVPGTQ